jgi:hypothetical protein
MTRSDLVITIQKLIDMRNKSPFSLERLMIERQLRRLRYSYEEAGGIIEDLDPCWGSYCRPVS